MNMQKIKLTLDLLAHLYFKPLPVLFEKAGLPYAKNKTFIKPKKFYGLTFINRALGHAEYYSLESILNAFRTGKNKFFIGDECEINHILDCFCNHLGIENTGVRRFVLKGAKFYFVIREDIKKPFWGGLSGDVYYAIPQQPSDIEEYLIDSLSCHSIYYVTKYQGLHNK